MKASIICMLWRLLGVYLCKCVHREYRWLMRK